MDICDRTQGRGWGQSIALARLLARRYVGSLLIGGVLLWSGGQPALAQPISTGHPATVSADTRVALSESSSQIRWRPNPDRGTASSTLSGGRRGARQIHCAADGAALSLLVPAEAAGLVTTQVEPTVAWHVDTEDPVNLEFVLSHPEQATPVYAKLLTVAETETVRVTLPALELDTRYRWTVFLSCDAQQTAEVHARSFIERVDFMPDGLTPALSNLDQARVYAAAGIWYDAYGALVTGEPQGQDAETQNLLQALLSQANPDHPLAATAE